ncbi:hypothetical protein AB4508_09050 [Vibrio splendidus]
MSIREAIKEIIGIVQSYPRDQVEYMKTLSNFAFNRGWYLNHIYLHVINVEDCIDSTFDAKIVGLIDDDIEGFWDLLNKASPDRTAIWQEIQCCYEHELYHSVIHLCFSQADGMFHEKFGTSLYQKSFSKAKESFGTSMCDALDHDSLSIHFKDGSVFKRMYNEVYLEYFNKSTSDLYKNTNKIVERSILLPNRHGVMHGVHFEYGTKINSYKAISFLQFILLAVYGEELGFS